MCPSFERRTRDQSALLRDESQIGQLYEKHNGIGRRMKSRQIFLAQISIISTCWDNFRTFLARIFRSNEPVITQFPIIIIVMELFPFFSKFFRPFFSCGRDWEILTQIKCVSSVAFSYARLKHMINVKILSVFLLPVLALITEKSIKFQVKDSSGANVHNRNLLLL